MRGFLIAGVAAVLLGGCRSAPTTAFDPAAAAFIHTQGGGVIDGHAFYRSETGSVVYAAGEHAYLIPVTAYAEQRFFQIYGKGKYVQAKRLPWSEADPQFTRFMREAKAESTGKFKFEHVAPGDYFVATSVSWQAENSLTPSGAAIYERVTVTGKEKDPINVIVSGK